MLRPVTSREEYLALRGSKSQLHLLQAAREGDAGSKRRLLQMNYSCLPGEDAALKGCRRPSRSVGMDIDLKAPAGLDPEQQRAWLDEQLARIPSLVLAHKDELGLLMLERSATKGYHLVFRRRPELTQEENLRWASRLLGVAYDGGAKDLTRVFYTTTAAPGELLFLDDGLFDNRPLEEEVQEPVSPPAADRRAPAVPERPETERPSRPMPETPEAPERAPAGDGEAVPAEAGTVRMERFPSEAADSPVPEPGYQGIPYSDIIAKYWELFNGGCCPVEGDRNVLTFELALNLRSICDYSLDKMMRVIPNYWAGQHTGSPQGNTGPGSGDDTQAGRAEWIRTLENALKEPRRGMPYRLRLVLKSLREEGGMQACGGTATAPPPLPSVLPPLIALLTSNVPPLYNPAVASAVFPALGAHLHGVKFRYWDNVEHEATFMNVLIGGQSIGKGCIRKPIEYIMDDIRQRDIPNRQREAQWKLKNPTYKQKREPRPTDICIQMLIDNLTDAVFNLRVVDAHNNGQRFIYTQVDEIESLKKVTSRGTLDEVGLLIRKAFDNALAGQERVGVDAVSGIAPLRWNFNASATPPNARRFLGRMVIDGTVSRLDIATIIRPDDNDDEAPVLGLYDHRFATALRPYIRRLECAQGLIECDQAKELSLALRSENAEAARLYDSEAFRIFSFRANVIAWLKGMVLYVAQGCRWDSTIEEFVRWSEHYNLWCKMLYFGPQLERELHEENEIQRQSGPQNLLELLPDEFSLEDYRQMRRNAGREGDGTVTLRSWIRRRHIAYDSLSGHYCKTREYKHKYGRAL